MQRYYKLYCNESKSVAFFLLNRLRVLSICANAHVTRFYERQFLEICQDTLQVNIHIYNKHFSFTGLLISRYGLT